ncbi:recombinase family protein [Deinococcus sp. YIM 134068]|uniref:recombinase family protein n=1 Tax=Deinococcus lichenicola TaxID=3118910 RepID=UPI002F937B34
MRSIQVLEAPFAQVTRLIADGCQAVYIETSSGDHLERPVLHRAVESLRRGDVLVVGDSDRLSRNLFQTDIILGRLQQKGATLHLLEVDRATASTPGP